MHIKFALSFHDLTAHCFLVLNNILLSRYTVVSIHSPPKGHIGSFQVLAFMSRAAINISVQVFVWT